MRYVSLSDIAINNNNLAPSQLSTLSIPNKSTKLVSDFFERPLQKKDNGIEVGSINYIADSHKFFVKAKALQSYSFVPIINEETLTPIRPQVFKNYNLRENDIIISKDSNIGEAVILDEDMRDYMLSGALYKLPVGKNKYYLFAFLKHSYFLKQLDIMTPKGATIKHAGKGFLDCKIPFPNKNANAIVEYVELLVQSIIRKQKAIKAKNKQIFNIIQNELGSYTNTEFNYNYPSAQELISCNRIDAGYYCYEFKLQKMHIQNYKNGYSDIEGLGYKIKRGQNLQESQIGKSIYSDEKHENFYSLIRPTNFTEYGTIEKFEYLGNPRRLSCIEVGDIIFSGEGTVGKCVLFTDDNVRWITNIHGIVLSKKSHNIKESAFVASFLRYLRAIGYFDHITVGGQGGSLAIKYWKDVIIPNFPVKIKNKIADLYCKNAEYPQIDSTVDFVEKDSKWEAEAGIIYLDSMNKKIKDILNNTLDSIINCEDVNISFQF